MTDPALEALFLPLFDGLVRLPQQTSLLFLRARAGMGLLRLRSAQPQWRVLAEQSFRPFADALDAQGSPVTAQAQGQFDAVLLLPPRQRAEARALLARALVQANEGGLVLASVANNEGARAIEADLERLGGAVASLSKHKCRVFWLRRDQARLDAALAEAWQREDAPQPIVDGRFLSRPGLFAWDRIDPASALLAAQLPPDLAGQGADLGAGYGYLACEVLKHCPQVKSMHLYEAEARALELAQLNLARCAPPQAAALEFHWHDVVRGLPQRYDFIVSNPPFHQGRADLPELGQAFVRVAAQALRPQGRLLLVANRHLPYEQTLARHFSRSQVLAEDSGFKVIQAQEPRA